MQKTTSKGGTHAHHANEFDLHDDLEKLKSVISDTTHNLKGKAGQVINNSYGTLRDKTTSATENLAEFIAERPFKAVGSAVLVGFLFGFLFRR